MPTTILDGETYEQARHRRFTEEVKVIENMQQDEIIRMALEAGFSSREDSSHMYAQSEFDKEICFEEYAIGERVARFAALVAANEREACAQIARKASDNYEGAEIASAIRARTT